MNTNTYAMRAVFTSFDGRKFRDDATAFFATLEDVKDAIHLRENSRQQWADDGFSQKAEYVVRYGSAANDWHAEEYVVTFLFNNISRDWDTAYDGFRATESCDCASAKDHARNVHNHYCLV